MPIIANTLQTTTVKTNREDLSKDVSRIFPEDFPILSDIQTEATKSTSPDWSTQTIKAPQDNAQLEADVYSYANTPVPVRYRNHTQIFRTTGMISNSQKKADEASNAFERSRQVKDRTLELMRDVEYSMILNNASVGGTVRKSGSIQTWLTTNVSRGAGGASGGFNTGTSLTSATVPGAQRAFTQGLLDNVMQSIAASGGKTRNMYLSLYNKGVFSSFVQNGQNAVIHQNINSGKGVSIISNADFYQGSFGKIMVKPSQIMGDPANPGITSRNIFLLDPENIKWLWFRTPAEDKKVASNADADPLVIIGEGCLKITNERAHGVIADVFGMTATS